MIGRGKRFYTSFAPAGSRFGRPLTPAEKQAARPPAAVPAVAAAPAAAAAPAPIGDAQYFADMARSGFSADQQRAQLDQQQAYDQTDLQEALRRMALKQPLDEQAAKEAANRQGLLFSGHLGQTLGNIDTSYARQQADQQLAFARRTASRKAAAAALDQGYTLDQAAGLAASADRQVASDQQAALGGYLAPNPSPTQTASAPKPAVQAQKAITTTGFNRKRNQRFSVVRRNGQIFHTYAGGRPVRVG